MTAQVVEIASKEKHPDADSLFIYQVKSNVLDGTCIQVVANTTNVYEVGDKVVFISIGSKLKDGLKISKRKIRGEYSYGMLAGLTDRKVGADLTEEYCVIEKEPAQVIRTKLKHQKWPSIESFAHTKKHAYKNPLSPFVNYTYGGKVKLHGTNAAVHISPTKEVVAQKRTSVIYTDNDNVGFAAWVEEHKHSFEQLVHTEHLIIHGEWVGNKIQKGVAVSQLEERQFAVFCIQVGLLEFGDARYYVDPKDIAIILKGATHPWRILPYHHTIDIDFTNDLAAAKAAKEIEEKVLEVEARDPWAFDNFNIEGIGEGLVYFPQVKGGINADDISHFIFKAKGEKHQSNRNKNKQIVPMSIEKLESLSAFVHMFLTPSRLNQGLLEACDNEFDITKMSSFLSWISKDIQKESVEELALSSLTWKEVNKPLMIEARKWYQSNI